MWRRLNQDDDKDDIICQWITLLWGGDDTVSQRTGGAIAAGSSNGQAA